MEVSIRFLSDPSEWIPLSVIQINSQIVSSTRHGYAVSYIYDLQVWDTGLVNGNITICNFSLTDSFQLRWLLNSDTFTQNKAPKDVWSLDDVKVTLVTECINHTLLEDSFEMNEIK